MGDRYQTLLDSIDEGYCIIEMLPGPDGRWNDYRFLETNRVFEQQSGLHDVVGRRARELMPVVGQDWFERYGRVADTGEPTRFTTESISLGRWFDIGAFRVGAPGDNRVGVLFTDITARHNAEQALRASEERYRNLFESSDEGFCIIEMIVDDRGKPIDYRFLEVNPTFEKQTGLHDAIRKRIRALVPEIEEHWIELLGQVALTGETVRFVKEAKALDGRWFDVYALRVGEPESLKVAVVFNDITVRLKNEETLATSEVRYRRLFESAHDGILILDTDRHQITDVNPFLLQLLGYDREYFIGKELWEIGFFADKAESQAAMTKVQQEGSIRFENKPLEDNHGGQHPVEIVANIYQENGHRVIQCNIRDISERVRFENERSRLLATEQASRLDAEAANRAKDTFLATLSHELRTPLNAILGWAVLLRNDSGDEATVKEAADVIERNARVQTQLIEDVLDVSRIVSGKLRLDMKACELSTIIADAVASVQTAADAKQIKINVEIVTGASPIFCDPGRVQQVIWNLLSNAIKFSPKVGGIQVLVERVNSMTRVSVADHGEGISPEFLPHVFERFRQSDGSSTRKHGGLGLGLNIVKHLVELHGGTASAKSEGLGRGATFVIDLPIRAIADVALAGGAGTGPAATAEGVDAGGAHPPVRLDGLRVLVVDDEPDTRNVIKRLLEQAGATVAAADSADTALALLEGVKPHVIVSDISMPSKDGYGLMKEIRARGAGYNGRELPAIALTAYARAEDRRRAFVAGYQMHVSKPVDPNELIVVVASLAGRTGMD